TASFFGNGADEFAAGHLALSGDTMVAGAPADTQSGSQVSGRVYVYRRDRSKVGKQWSLRPQITPGTRQVRFGERVALTPEHLFIGSVTSLSATSAATAIDVFE